MRTRSSLLAIVMLALIAASCRRDMQDQPKYKPLQQSRFFTDGRSARPVPAHTIARDELNNDDAVHTGQTNGVPLDVIPIPVNSALLNRGRDRYNIYCSPCHGYVGDGDGMVAKRGLRAPANFHTQRLREVPPGYIFEVITDGYGAMGDYRSQIPSAHDRWAIVAYVRALQLARNASLADVPSAMRGSLEAGK